MGDRSYQATWKTDDPSEKIADMALEAVGNGYESRIEEVILCHWNRDYPADMYFKMDLGSWKLAETQEYAGSSHEKITEERYVRR